jgi:hypothetical protein
VLSGEATNINFIVFGLTRPGFEPTNHYTTDAVNKEQKEIFYAIKLSRKPRKIFT